MSTIQLKSFKKITEALENYAFVQFIDENKDDDKFSLNDAKDYYKSLK